MAYKEPGTVPPLTVRTAANRLGMSVWGVHRAVERGELKPVVRHPIKVSAADVESMRLRKQSGAIERIGADRLVKTAREVRAKLHPPVTSGAPRGHDALEDLPEATKQALGPALLAGAAMPDGSGCRWCAATVAGELLRTPVAAATLAGEVGVALLGEPGCEEHRALLRGRMAEFAAEVHPGVTRPSTARSGLVRAPVGQRPQAPVVRPAARALVDDGGKALVSRRRREVQARLKAARRSGDLPYALRLQRQLQSLVADAARIDGRSSVTASARPGVLRCGHRLDARCSCPRRASRRES